MENSTEQSLKLAQVMREQAEIIVQSTEKLWTPERVNMFRNSLSQLNNALEVASQTESPRVVLNWIAYQMGRKETRSKWGDSGLGKAIQEQLHDLDSTLVSGISRQVYGDDSPNHHRSVLILVIRQYLGFLKRWFVAKGGQA